MDGQFDKFLDGDRRRSKLHAGVHDDFTMGLGYGVLPTSAHLAAEIGHDSESGNRVDHQQTRKHSIGRNSESEIGASHDQTRKEVVQYEHDHLAISIERLLESLPTLLFECCVYKVPKKLRSVNEDAYTPRVVSIGPLHYDHDGLDVTKEHKLRYLQSFLNRTNLCLLPLIPLASSWEEKARCFYAERVKMVELDSDDFVQVLLLDGIFVIELLWRFQFPELVEKSDHIFRKPRMLDDVARDMILLENQLPFFVLERIFEQLCYCVQRTDISFVELVHKFFKHLTRADRLPNSIENHKIEHLVDLFRAYYLPTSPHDWVEGNRDDEIPPSATELNKAGVKFKKKTGTSLLDIEFTNGTLIIPHLEVDDETETFFRNIIAFEQCHGLEKYIIHYMFFMDSLINTSDDVDLLTEHGIITRKLGSNEDVSVLFNNICKGVISGHKFYFFNLCKELKAYCKIPRHHYMAVLRRDYFNTPWAIISFIAAFVLLVLTFIQSVCSILSL